MRLFKKKEEIVDLTDLQRRGILKKPEEQDDTATLDSVAPVSSPTEDANPLAFLDALASSNSETQSSSSLLNTPNTSGVNIKLDDLEYKLDRMMDRLAIMETKLQGFEKKQDGD